MSIEKRKTLTACFTVLMVFLMVLIFWFSAQEADDSQELSEGFYWLLMSGRIPLLSWLALETPFFDVFPLRKCAHAFVYFCLGIASGGRANASGQYEIKGGRAIVGRALLPWLVCVWYACTDELHQLFVAGRSGELRDVCIDGGGAAVGVLLIFALFYAGLKKGENS